MSSVTGAPVHPRYSPVTVTSSLVSVGPGPVHVSLGVEFFNFDINIQHTMMYKIGRGPTTKPIVKV